MTYPRQTDSRQRDNAPALVRGRKQSKKAIINSSLAYVGPQETGCVDVYEYVVVRRVFVEEVEKGGG